ncbi:hypothetical protein ACUOAQ_19100, partial [Escherichia sp. SP-MK]
MISVSIAISVPLSGAAEMMSVSDGVMRLPLFLAMILPVQLGAATADACTFIDVGLVTRNRNEG